MKFQIETFFDPLTSTLTYLVFDESTKDAVIIDPVLDFDSASGKIWDASLQKYFSFILEKKLNLHFVLETHAHADHISGAQYIKIKYPNVKVAIGAQIVQVQNTFKKIFGLSELKTDGSQFDLLLKDGEEFSAGSILVQSISTPGHTPACVSYSIDDALFTGDLLFIPDSGTGRCDFPAGNARELFQSVKNKIYSKPDSTRLYVGHDYQPEGRELKFASSVGEQKLKNIHIKAQTTENEFVEFRISRDRTLAAPKLLLPSIQINIAAGHLPEPSENSVRYLKIPLQIAFS